MLRHAHHPSQIEELVLHGNGWRALGPGPRFFATDGHAVVNAVMKINIDGSAVIIDGDKQMAGIGGALTMLAGIVGGVGVLLLSIIY